MNPIGKLGVVAFLFLLTGMAAVSAQYASGVGPAQVDQLQQKLCLTCHSPRFLPNDASHDHLAYAYDVHDWASPCYLCHGDYYIDWNELFVETHNPSNVQHPTVDEAIAMGKDDYECAQCHYPHNIQEELRAGSIIAATPPYVPNLSTWAFMIAAGIVLITGICAVGVSLSLRGGSNKGG